jgi:hypothetical protein
MKVINITDLGIGISNNNIMIDQADIDKKVTFKILT